LYAFTGNGYSVFFCCFNETFLQLIETFLQLIETFLQLIETFLQSYPQALNETALQYLKRKKYCFFMRNKA